MANSSLFLDEETILLHMPSKSFNGRLSTGMPTNTMFKKNNLQSVPMMVSVSSGAFKVGLDTYNEERNKRI